MLQTLYKRNKRRRFCLLLQFFSFSVDAGGAARWPRMLFKVALALTECPPTLNRSLAC